MKKVKNLLITAIVAVCAAIACFAFAACGDTAVEGTYKFSSMTVITEAQTVTVKVGEEYNGMIITENFMVLELKADGTFTLSAMGEKIGEGIWIEKEGVVKFTDQSGTTEATHSGKTLTLIYMDEGVALTLSK